jgi:hypothetical protein
MTETAPYRWTPETRATFLDILYRTGNAQRAARAVDKSRQAAYALRSRDADFAAAWDDALADARDLYVDELSDRAVEGVEEAHIYRGKLLGTRVRQDNRLIIATVKRLDRIVERREDREERALIRAEAREERATIRAELRAEQAAYGDALMGARE